MRKSIRQETLQGPPEACENTREKLRQRLADLIGKLLAQHWLKQQAQTEPTQSASRPGKAK